MGIQGTKNAYRLENWNYEFSQLSVGDNQGKLVVEEDSEVSLSKFSV
jgi:hypothetical protein